MKYLLVLTAILLISFAPGGNNRAASPLPSNNQTPVQYIKATFIPDYAEHEVDVVGFVEETTCDHIDVSWIKKESYLEITQDLDAPVCPFYIPNFGTITRNNNVYILNLPELTLPEQSSLLFAVWGADISSQAIQPPAVSRDKSNLLWLINGEVQKDSLKIPIHPWTHKISISLMPLLFGNLEAQLQGNLLFVGESTLSDLNDLRNYYALTKRQTNINEIPDISELLLMYLDNAPHLTTDVYPGFRYLHDEYNLILQASISSYGLKNSTTTSPSVDSSPTDTGEKIEADSELLSDVQIIEHGEIKVKFAGNQQSRISSFRLPIYVRLGPHDELTIHIPNSVIISSSIPPNQEPDPSTVVYDGPGTFTTIIEYNPTIGLWMQQFPFAVRATTATIESVLLTTVSINRIFAFCLALVIFSLVTFVKGIWSIKTQAASIKTKKIEVGSLIIDLLTLFGLGSMLLFAFPSASGLLLLPLYLLFPHLCFDKKQKKLSLRAFIPPVILIIVVTIDNFLNLNYIDSIKPLTNSISILTPAVFAFTLFIMLWAYYPHGETEEKRSQNPNLELVRLPSYAMFFLIIATYEIVGRSLFSLIIIISSIYLIKLRTTHHNSSALPVMRWSRHLNSILKEPVIIILIILSSIWVVQLGSQALNGIIYSILTIVASTLLFASIYDFMPGNAGYIKAIMFFAILLSIFLTGIVATDVQINYNGISSRYAVFMNSFGTLVVSRIIYYLTVPLLVGLYLEFQEKIKIDANKGNNLSTSLKNFFYDIKSVVGLVVTIISILAPTLYIQLGGDKTVTTITDLIDKIVSIVQGSGAG